MSKRENAIDADWEPVYDTPTLHSDDPINPPHYKDLKPEPFDVIEGWKLDYFCGSALKYIARAGKKPGNSAKQDIEKAICFLQRKLKNL